MAGSVMQISIDDPPFDKPLIKSSEIARLFDINLSTVSFWVKTGRLKPKRTIGGNYRFAREHIWKLWEEHCRQEQTKERRREPRIRCFFQANVQIGGGSEEQSFDATLLNISDHGMGFLVQGDESILATLQNSVKQPMTMIRRNGEETATIARGIIMHVSREQGRDIVVGARLE